MLLVWRQLPLTNFLHYTILVDYHCDFEEGDLCEFINEEEDDDVNWNLQSGIIQISAAALH